MFMYVQATLEGGEYTTIVESSLINTPGTQLFFLWEWGSGICFWSSELTVIYKM